jgi:hypothetical protein
VIYALWILQYCHAIFTFYKKVILMDISCFSKIIYHASVQDAKVSGAGVLTSQVHASLVLLIVEKLKTGSQCQHSCEVL